MDQKDISFIQKRWAGRACGSDVKQLVDEIARLEDIIDAQAYAIEDKIMDTIAEETERDFFDDGAD